MTYIPNTDEAAQEGARPLSTAGSRDEVEPARREEWTAVHTCDYDGAE